MFSGCVPQLTERSGTCKADAGMRHMTWDSAQPPRVLAVPRQVLWVSDAMALIVVLWSILRARRGDAGQFPPS